MPGRAGGPATRGGKVHSLFSGSVQWVEGETGQQAIGRQCDGPGPAGDPALWLGELLGGQGVQTQDR